MQRLTSNQRNQRSVGSSGAMTTPNCSAQKLLCLNGPFRRNFSKQNSISPKVMLFLSA